MIMIFDEEFNRNYVNLLDFEITKFPNCLECNTNRNFRIHDSYNRGICAFNKGVIIRTVITIPRLYCCGCKKTQALLPDDIIPYSYYCKSFIMYCLELYYVHDKKVSEIVAITNTYEKLIYNFINHFTNDAYSLIIFLRDYLSSKINTSSKGPQLVRILKSISNFRKFLKDYFLGTNKIFLMKKRQNIISKKTLIGYQICKVTGFT